MVSTKSNKASYADRVLGAFSYLQREHRKHDIHVATLRAQVKRHARAKKDTLGPQWAHWVSKAVAKLENEGILEHTDPGTVALTSGGKKLIADARRSFQNGSPQKDKDDLIWKQVTTTASRGVKRPRKSSVPNRGSIDSDLEDDTASMAGKQSPRKRPRASVGSSPTKSTSRLTKAELQQELASVKKAYAAAIRRPSSPLTDLSDDDNDENAQLKEKLKERDQAIENMRRELYLMKNEVSREQNQAAGRSDTPGPTLNFDQMSSPVGVPATMSRLRTMGVTRTQSGSHIPNLSKQPTPAPSSPGRDDDYGRGTESPDVAMDDNGEALAASLGHAKALSIVNTLKSEIQDLEKRVAADIVVISNKETEIFDLEKVISDRDRVHESTISDRDETIAGLREKVSELMAEANDLRESCRLGEETAAVLTFQLQETEAFVTNLRVEADVSKTKLEFLEMSNANLLRDQASMKLDLEQAKAECIEAENTAEDVRKHAKAVSDELCSLKILQDEQMESLSRASNDAQALRENYRMLEASVAGYEAEIQENDGIRQNLEIQVKKNDSRIVQLSAMVQTVEKSVEDMKTRLAEANKRAADAELVNEKLKTELSLMRGTMQQYQDELTTVRGQFADAEVEIIESATKHTHDSVILSSTISDLQDALANANSDIERLSSQLRAVEDERMNIQEDLGKKGADLLETFGLLEEERQARLAFEADLMAYVTTTKELKEELGYLKTSKEADEATISSLRASFMKLRRSQLQIFGEFEREISPP